MIDHFYRLAYRGAYQMMRVYWLVRHPQTHGALVALWHANEILLVRNSYVPYYSLPGGYVRKDETGQQAALRELREETAVDARLEDLRSVFDQFHEWEGKHERIEIFGYEPVQRPRLQLDGREVIDARFFPADQALGLDLFPPIRVVIENRLARSRPAATAKRPVP